MPLRSLKRKVQRTQHLLYLLVSHLPGERELWRYIHQQGDTRSLSWVTDLWWPVIQRAMRRNGHGYGPYSSEEVLKFLECLRDGPRPPITITVFWPVRPVSQEELGDTRLERSEMFPTGETERKETGPLVQASSRDLNVEPESPQRAETTPKDEPKSYSAMIMESDSHHDWDRTITEQLEEIHEFAEDERLLIVCDHGSSDSDAGIVEEEWATKHQNPEARASRCRIWFGDSQVEEIFLVGVDGGRARLPRPRDVEGSLVVDPFEYKIAEIVSLRGELEKYMISSGLNIPAISSVGSGSVKAPSKSRALRSRTDRTPQE